MASVKRHERLHMLSRVMEKKIYIVYKIIKTLKLLKTMAPVSRHLNKMLKSHKGTSPVTLRNEKLLQAERMPDENSLRLKPLACS